MSPLLVIVGLLGAVIYLTATFLTMKHVRANGGGWVKTPLKLLLLYGLSVILIFSAVLPLIFAEQV